MLDFSWLDLVQAWLPWNSLCRPDWLQTHRDLSGSASQVLWFRVLLLTTANPWSKFYLWRGWTMDLWTSDIKHSWWQKSDARLIMGTNDIAKEAPLGCIPGMVWPGLQLSRQSMESSLGTSPTSGRKPLISCALKGWGNPLSCRCSYFQAREALLKYG